MAMRMNIKSNPAGLYLANSTKWHNLARNTHGYFVFCLSIFFLMIPLSSFFHNFFFWLNISFVSLFLCLTISILKRSFLSKALKHHRLWSVWQHTFQVLRGVATSPKWSTGDPDWKQPVAALGNIERVNHPIHRERSFECHTALYVYMLCCVLQDTIEGSSHLASNSAN